MCLALYVSLGVAVTYIQYSLVELQGWIAQWLEHLVYVQKVLGSIPGLVTFLYSNRLWAPPCACVEMVIQEVSD